MSSHENPAIRKLGRSVLKKYKKSLYQKIKENYLLPAKDEPCFNAENHSDKENHSKQTKANTVTTNIVTMCSQRREKSRSEYFIN